VAAVADIARGKTRLPTVRLLAFGLCWSWIETAATCITAALWIAGQRNNTGVHYALQRRWTETLIGALRVTTGVAVTVHDVDALRPGPAVVLCRHASLADSLVSAWVVTSVARMKPRYVLKRELLSDPCLDIVGNRLPNHFLDRQAPDSGPELAALADLASGLGNDEVAVIFPEGTRASSAKRERALARIGERDPARASRLAALQHLLPPRPAGSVALLDGCPQADLVLAWHVGFDGLDTFSGIYRRLAREPRPAEFHARRVPRADVPTGEAFMPWLDEAWLRMDSDVDRLLLEGGT
jgi:1-acyl-sn-glycerol-3-phosphate acyltransferase